MKTLIIIFITSLMLSFSVTAQTTWSVKPDSMRTKKVAPHQDLFPSPYKFHNPLLERHYKLYAPELNQSNRYQNFALNHRFGRPQPYRQFSRMPVFIPKFQSKMPIYRPDNSIDYKLRIKRFDVWNPEGKKE